MHYVYTEEQLVKLCNEIKEVVLQDLVLQNYLTEDERNFYLSSRVLMGYKKSWFGRIWNILNKSENEIASKDDAGEILTIAPFTVVTDDNQKQNPPERKNNLHLLKKD